jgi:uncharacterized membrane protein YfcA
MKNDMVRIVSARAIGLIAVLIVFFMDHQLFMPFGLFLAFGLFIISAYIYRDFMDSRPMNEKQTYWSIVLAMVGSGIVTQLARATNINLTTNQRIAVFSILVLIVVVYTMIDAKRKIEKLEQKRLTNKSL